MDDDPRTSRLRANLEGLRARIEAARRRGPHPAQDVRLVTVTKSRPASILGPLRAAGATDVGENRVQQGAARRPGAPAGLVWHLIGPLQRNKATPALEAFDVFHALDGLRLARRLERLLAERERTWPVFVQVNAAREPQKHGFAPEKVPEALEALAGLPHLEVVGLMAMAAQGAEESALRTTFGTLRDLRDEAVQRGRGTVAPAALSMGMSDDFEIAVEEGATHVRVGRAVFQGIPEDADQVPSATDGPRRKAGGAT